jgi:hypothetical protein
MTTRTRMDPRKNFVPRFLPWLLVAATFALYWLTLNRWVSPMNIDAVARISGWTWLPQVASPVSFLVTYPFRWLPVSQIPLALNLFSAACAALTLGLLARSVALLPQDRSPEQIAEIKTKKKSIHKVYQEIKGKPQDIKQSKEVKKKKDVEKESDLLLALKRDWRMATSKDHTKFLEWLMENKREKLESKKLKEDRSTNQQA